MKHFNMIVLDLKLPSFNTLIHNYRCSYNMKLSTSDNILISNLRLASDNLLCFSSCMFVVCVFALFQCVWLLVVLAAFIIIIIIIYIFFILFYFYCASFMHFCVLWHLDLVV